MSEQSYLRLEVRYNPGSQAGRWEVWGVHSPGAETLIARLPRSPHAEPLARLFAAAPALEAAARLAEEALRSRVTERDIRAYDAIDAALAAVAPPASARVVTGVDRGSPDGDAIVTMAQRPDGRIEVLDVQRGPAPPRCEETGCSAPAAPGARWCDAIHPPRAECLVRGCEAPPDDNLGGGWLCLEHERIRSTEAQALNPWDWLAWRTRPKCEHPGGCQRSAAPGTIVCAEHSRQVPSYPPGRCAVRGCAHTNGVRHDSALCEDCNDARMGDPEGTLLDWFPRRATQIANPGPAEPPPLPLPEEVATHGAPAGSDVAALTEALQGVVDEAWASTGETTPPPVAAIHCARITRERGREIACPRPALEGGYCAAHGGAAPTAPPDRLPIGTALTSAGPGEPVLVSLGTAPAEPLGALTPEQHAEGARRLRAAIFGEGPAEEDTDDREEQARAAGLADSLNDTCLWCEDGDRGFGCYALREPGSPFCAEHGGPGTDALHEEYRGSLTPEEREEDDRATARLTEQGHSIIRGLIGQESTFPSPPPPPLPASEIRGWSDPPPDLGEVAVAVFPLAGIGLGDRLRLEVVPGTGGVVTVYAFRRPPLQGCVAGDCTLPRAEGHALCPEHLETITPSPVRTAQHNLIAGRRTA